MEKMQRVDNILVSAFDKFVEQIFQQTQQEPANQSSLPFNTIGDYIELYREKKVLESRIKQLNQQVYLQNREIKHFKDKMKHLAKREKRLVKERKDAEKASNQKSSFLANMSHEIRTPMNGILGTVTILKKSVEDPEQIKFLEIIETCANSLLTIIDDILDFSKIEAGEMSIENIDFNLKEIVSQTKEILFHKVQEKDIVFTTHIHHDVPLWLTGDPIRIRQILLNLASNAVKFTNTGSVNIDISLANEEAKSADLHFVVKDTGIGISKNRQRQLFDSYAQAKQSTTREYGGTGLGLSISKKLTELMGGKIGVNSQEGQGAEFWFDLRLLKQIGTKNKHNDLLSPKTSKQTGNKYSEKNLSLLLVEDDPINQKITQILLEKEGYAIKVASSGKEAIVLLEQEHYDLVLMDIEMPGLNGYQTTQKIRNSQGKSLDRNCKIIAMTAHAMSGDREKCLKAGMDDYISKPINVHVLNDLIQNHLGEKDQQLEEVKEETENESEPSVQLENLMHLKEEVEDRFGLLIDMFLDNLPQKLSNINSSVDERNFEDLRIYAHQLKGSCAAFYAEKMVEICQDIELLATSRSKNPDKISNRIEDLVFEAQKVESFLKTNLT